MTQDFPRVAPDMVHETTPGLGRFTDRVLFGQVWPSAALAPRDRSLLTVSALIAGGKVAQIGSHAGRALDNGLTPTELAEIAAQLAFYTGWPNAMSAAAELDKVFDTRGIPKPKESDAPRIDLPEEAEAARARTVAQNVAPTAPTLARLTDEVLFGDLWQRPDLSPRDRSLATVAALVMLGQPEQLPFHLNRALDNGLTGDEAGETLAHLAFYAGWPRAMSAVPVLKQVLEARKG
ncbi:4-carboxymuconolactone decarboxylase [Marinibacterium anthonyi]|nr:4-carboxymuconolactone decarboxylase [Marinibacterium anthonyi]